MDYFEPPCTEVLNLGLSQYEQRLLSSLAHTLSLGVHLYRSLNAPALVSGINMARDGASECSRYITAALNTNFNSDKFFPLRQTGASMRAMMRVLPPVSATRQHNMSRTIFQLCIWRTFAFGNVAHIGELDLGQTPNPSLESIVDTIKGWCGEFRLTLGAYGNFGPMKARIREMIKDFFKFAHDLACEIDSSQALLTFAEVYDRLCRAGVDNRPIVSIPRSGIIAWVLVCDFSELNICQPPTEKDLAGHIFPLGKPTGGPSGPTGALHYIAQQSGEQQPRDAASLEKVLFNVVSALVNPPTTMPTIRKLVRDCEDIQNRKLGIADVEHALCKIARQLSMIDKKAGYKKIKETPTSKKRKGSEMTSEETKKRS